MTGRVKHGRTLRLRQPLPDRESGEFDPVVDVELSHQVRAVLVHGVDADVHEFGDFVIGRLAGAERSVSARGSTLTDREMQVLRYIARGLAKKEIAEFMHVSVNTVDKHSAHLMRKLDIHDRVALARFAIREGLSEP